MGLVSSIKNGLSLTIGRAFADGIIQYRLLTNNSNSPTRTYGPWITIPDARVITGEKSVMQDPDTGMYYTVEFGEVRVPAHAGITLQARAAQVWSRTIVTDKGQIWDVAKRLNHNVGSITGYALDIKTPYVGNHRSGAV